jgi:hypothetical protein
MFGLSKRERADREIKEIITYVLGQSTSKAPIFHRLASSRPESR